MHAKITCFTENWGSWNKKSKISVLFVFNTEFQFNYTEQLHDLSFEFKTWIDRWRTVFTVPKINLIAWTFSTQGGYCISYQKKMNKKTPVHSSEVLEDIGQDLILTNIRDKLLFSIKLFYSWDRIRQVWNLYLNSRKTTFMVSAKIKNLVRVKVRTGKHLACEQVSTGKILWLRRQIILTG